MSQLPPTLPGQEPNAPVVPRYREAFERTRAEIEAVPDSELVHINVDVMDLVSLAVVSAKRALELKPRAALILVDFDVTYFDILETRALALAHAHARYLAACGDPDQIPGLSRRAREVRGTLREDVVCLIHHELVPEDALDKLSRTRSHKAAGFDLLALVQIFRTHWDKVEGRSATGDVELTDAECLAELLFNKVSTRKQNRAAIRAAARTRSQAFALLLEAYGQVHRAVHYLRHEHGDAGAIIPSAYRGRAKRHRKGAGADADSSSEEHDEQAGVDDLQ